MEGLISNASYRFILPGPTVRKTFCVMSFQPAANVSCIVAAKLTIKKFQLRTEGAFGLLFLHMNTRFHAIQMAAHYLTLWLKFKV